MIRRLIVSCVLGVLAGAVHVAVGDIIPTALAPLVAERSPVAEAGLSNCESYEWAPNSNHAYAVCYAYSGPNSQWVRVQAMCVRKTNAFDIIVVNGPWTRYRYPSRSHVQCSTVTHDLFKVRWQLLNENGVVIVTSVWRNV